MEVEISFKVLLKSLFKHIAVILLIVLIVAILAAVYTEFFVTPVYRATTASSLLVKDMNATQGNNLSTTINMMSTYAIKVTSDETMQIASDMISNGALTPSQIRSLISVSYEEKGTVLYISAVYTDPENAARIANAVTQAAVYSISNVEWDVTNNAVAPSSPASPSMTKNVLLASFVAFVLSYALFLLFDIYNTKIVSEEQLSNVLGVPVLGAIPLVDTATTSKRNAEEVNNNGNQ